MYLMGLLALKNWLIESKREPKLSMEKDIMDYIDYFANRGLSMCTEIHFHVFSNAIDP